MTQHTTPSPRPDSTGGDPRGPQYRYNAQLADTIELKWQAWWDAHNTFVVKNPGEPGFDASRPKFYCLDMFPYPSGAGLHVGHPEGYTATDILCRFKRMKGCNVLHPMGYDAFGLPAEQYAIQTGVHPAITTKKSIETFRRQLKRFGFCYDWSREVATIDPEYYKWTQWIFLKLYNTWYDPSCKRPDGGVGSGRLIADLVGELERGVRGIGPSGEIVSLESGNVLSGSAIGIRRWHELSERERRAVIDDHRLAYIGEQTVNWCPKLGTVLANDEVIDGRSERGGYPVLRKPLRQWMFRITAYAQRLLDDLDTINWPSSTKTMQAEWIGRSEGAEIDFSVHVETDKAVVETDVTLTVYTTRPDTIFGATYMVVAPEHPLVESVLRTPPPQADVTALHAYVQQARNRSDIERQESKEKSGVFTGVHCQNPATGQLIPVWTADYVLMGYGTGAIMAVPAHDERDFEFAKKFELEIKPVIDPTENWLHPRRPKELMKDSLDPTELFGLYNGNPALFGTPFIDDGMAINSANADISLDGLATIDAKKRITEWLEAQGIGNRKVNFKLRDWTFSRQRYWGEPFPIVFDAHGNHYPVSDAALPVRLPELSDYAPIESEDPLPLLGKARDWMNTTAGAAGVDPKVLAPQTPVTRETNTMPGSAGSSWYFLRYCDAHNSDRFISREAESYWMDGGVDFYIGGSEHAVGHLLYSRFWHKVLYDLGEVSSREPFAKLFHQGLITSFSYQRADKTLCPNDQVDEVSEGVYIERATGAKLTPVVAKMSKSLKNVVNPDDVIAEFGADTFRLYEMYMGPLEQSKPWNPRDIAGCFRFLQRAWRLCVDEETGNLRATETTSPDLEKLLHRMIHKVGADIDRLAFNTAIATMIEFVNAGTSATPTLTRHQIGRFALCLAPFAPHLCEELWSKLGHATSIADEPWPAVDDSLLRDDSVELPVQIAGKVRSRVTVAADANEETIRAAALADEKVIAFLADKSVQKVIIVPGKMVNIVAK